MLMLYVVKDKTKTNSKKQEAFGSYKVVQWQIAARGTIYLVKDENVAFLLVENLSSCSW